MKFKSLPVFALLMLSGCSLIPDYQQPVTPVQAQWPTGQAYNGQGDQRGIATVLPQAKEFFKDPALIRLLDVALENNRDLRIAAKNVESYRALYRIQRAERFPTVDGEISGNRTRLPDGLSPTGDSRIDSQYQVGLVTAYELDLFDRIRSLQLMTDTSSVILAVGIAFMPLFAYVTRAVYERESAAGYVTAARVIGVSPLAIAWRHVMPNAIGTLLTQIAIVMPRAITTESVLSFFGMGVAPDVPTWGRIIASAAGFAEQAPLSLLFPVLALALTTLSLSMVGNRMREHFDPLSKPLASGA